MTTTPQLSTIERRIGNFIDGYRRDLIPTLPEDRRPDVERFFEEILHVSRIVGANIEGIRGSRDLTEEGRARRIADERSKALVALNRFIQEQAVLEKELAAERHAALQGFVPLGSYGYGGRETTPAARADRVADLLTRLPEQQRIDVYVAACQDPTNTESWEVVDAIERVPVWARQVPDRIIETGQSMRLAASPCAPRIRAMEATIAARTALVESAIRNVQEF